MFVKKKSNIMFRDYGTFGYITDNRNFGYKRIDDKRDDIGEKIISKSGSIFFSVLTKEVQYFTDLVEKISKLFPHTDITTLRCDAEDFYKVLEKEGFIALGETIEECESKDEKFSYIKNLKQPSDKKIEESILKTSQDFLAEYFQEKPQLTSIHVEITGKCNERCLHCYIPHEKKLENIDSELFYKILNQCIDMNLLHITISGGEPMLHQDFCDYLRICRENELSVNVLSNLTLLDDNILEELKKNPLAGVQVSLYSMNPDIHDKITNVKGSFKKTKDAIMKLIANDIPLKISCPILKLNRTCYKDVLEWANGQKIQVGTDYVILAKYDHTLENLEHRLSIREVKQLINEIAINDDNYINEIKAEAEKKKNSLPEDYVCSVCNSSICINETGSVYPCAGWQDYTLGNINTNSLSEIWNESNKVKKLRNIRNKDFPQCLKCSVKDYCTMCMVRNANENKEGNPLIVNEFFCNIAKFHKSLVAQV